MISTKKRQITEESIEAKHGGYTEPTTVSDEIKDLLNRMADSAWKDMLGGVSKDFGSQIMGSSMAEGQEVSLKKQAEQTKDKKSEITSEFIDYRREVINVERASENQVERQVAQAVEEIRMEIKKLTQTSKLVERTVKDATADKAPVKPGKYHLNFFEFVLNMLKDATRKLEDSVSFGAVFTSKKQQSQYWNTINSKKGGTAFMLSGERTSATQTG